MFLEDRLNYQTTLKERYQRYERVKLETFTPAPSTLRVTEVWKCLRADGILVFELIEYYLCNEQVQH